MIQIFASSTFNMKKNVKGRDEKAVGMDWEHTQNAVFLTLSDTKRPMEGIVGGRWQVTQ